MRVVGVTGKYCAGKDAVVQILAENGYQEIDVDALGHEALVSQHHRVVDSFGPRILSDQGTIDRSALGRIVFSDTGALRRLEQILHPEMVRRVADRINENAASSHAPPGIAVNAAILFRMKLDALCETVLYVTAPFIARLRRARDRDGAGLISALRRLAAQRDVVPQYSSSDADIQRVENDGSREQLRERVRSLLLLP